MACLLLLNVVFAPDWIGEGMEVGGDAGRPIVTEPTAIVSEGPKAPKIPAAARVPTIVARFSTESKEPVDESGIKSLATAMIEDHDARVVLEGHSDTLGAEDFNHDLSLERANLVKARLVALGVSEERVETVGLGATHPLHSDAPDAASVNRRVEVRWVGKAEFESRRKNPDLPRITGPAALPAPVFAGQDAAPVARPEAGTTNTVVADAGNTVGTMAADAGSSAMVEAPATDSDAGQPRTQD